MTTAPPAPDLAGARCARASASTGPVPEAPAGRAAPTALTLATPLPRLLAAADENRGYLEKPKPFLTCRTSFACRAPRPNGTIHSLGSIKISSQLANIQDCCSAELQDQDQRVCRAVRLPGPQARDATPLLRTMRVQPTTERTPEKFLLTTGERVLKTRAVSKNWSRARTCSNDLQCSKRVPLWQGGPSLSQRKAVCFRHRRRRRGAKGVKGPPIGLSSNGHSVSGTNNISCHKERAGRSKRRFPCWLRWLEIGDFCRDTAPQSLREETIYYTVKSNEILVARAHVSSGWET